MTYSVEPRHLSDDNEETFAVEIETPNNALLQMTMAQSSGVSPLSQVPGEVSTHPLSNPFANQSCPVPCTLDTNFSNIDLPPRGLRVDPLRPIIISPTLHPEAEYLFGSTRPVLMNSNVQSYLREIRSGHQDSLDFLERMINIPQVDL